MNLILFTERELREGLPISDPRMRHILEVLRRLPGESFDVGIIDGRRGKASIVSESGSPRLRFDYELNIDPPELYPVVLLVGFSRPQTMRRVLRDCTSLGVRRFRFFATDRGERGYAESALWTDGEYRHYLIDGAQQAFSTRLPEVAVSPSLSACLAEENSGSSSGSLRVALDNYESSRSLGAALRQLRPQPGRLASPPAPSGPVWIIVGSERGWSPAERECLRSHGVPLLHLGPRVLRTDVACISAVTVVLSALGFHDGSG